MMDDKKIPSADQLWPAAEKMLDRHFRNRRLIRWSASIIIPAMIISIFYLISTSKKPVEKNTALTVHKESDVSVRNESNPSIQKEQITIVNTDNKSIPVNSENISKAIASSNSNQSISPIKTEINQVNKIAESEKLISDIKKQKSYSNTSIKNPNSNSSAPNIVSKKTKDLLADENLSVANKRKSSFSTTKNEIRKNKHESSTFKKEEVFRVNKSNSPESNNGVSFRTKSDEPVYAMNKSDMGMNELPVLKSILPNFEVPIENGQATENNWPKKAIPVTNSHTSWEASFYGGVNYIQKTLSITNDWNNYLLHRKNEEEAIIAPSIGLSLSANIKSVKLSMGIEYSMYGEKTNYYPYSLQQSYIDLSGWQTDSVNYIHVDTAFITGNTHLFNTTLIRLDSTYVIAYDTIDENKYDKHIAESNGVNKIYYLEVPIEVSYTLSKGKAGFGLSAGISPAWLTREKGSYIRNDGRGIESLSDIKYFRKFLVNGRISIDFYYRCGARTKLVFRPQLRTNLNSVFGNDYGIKQRYYSTGVLFGITYMLN